MKQTTHPVAQPLPVRPVQTGLIAAGERLIGEAGLAGVSLRQVSAAAGTRNNYAVQYHFGDLMGLIRAIVTWRTPEIEQRRAAALAAADKNAPFDTRAVIDIFFRPLIDLVDEDRLPHFARFMLALHSAPDGWKPLDDMFFMMPVTERLLDLFKAANPHIPSPVIWQRLRPISVMVLTYACGPTVIGGAKEYRDNVIDGLFDMAAAALSVPVRETTASKVYGMVF